MVSELEERDAARFLGIPWPMWKRQHRDERIEGVAHYRLSNLIGAYVRSDQERQARRDAARAKAAREQE